MTVRELIEGLQDVDPDMVVVISADGEGNSYSELSQVNEDDYSYDEAEGNIGLRELTQEHEDDGYAEEDVMEDGVPCVVLWPS